MSKSSKAITVFVIGAALGAVVGSYVIAEKKVPAKPNKKKKS